MRAILVFIFTSALAIYLAVGGPVQQMDNFDDFQALLHNKTKFVAAFIYKDSCPESPKGISVFTKACNLPENADIKCIKSNNYEDYFVNDTESQNALDLLPSLVLYLNGTWDWTYSILKQYEFEMAFQLFKKDK